MSCVNMCNIPDWENGIRRMQLDPSPPSRRCSSVVPKSSRIPHYPTAPFIGLDFKGWGVIMGSFSFAFSVERLWIFFFFYVQIGVSPHSTVSTVQAHCRTLSVKTF